MFSLAAIPFSLEQLGVFLAGIALGALANWAIYRLAWNPRRHFPMGTGTFRCITQAIAGSSSDHRLVESASREL